MRVFRVIINTQPLLKIKRGLNCCRYLLTGTVYKNCLKVINNCKELGSRDIFASSLKCYIRDSTKYKVTHVYIHGRSKLTLFRNKSRSRKFIVSKWREKNNHFRHLKGLFSTVHVSLSSKNLGRVDSGHSSLTTSRVLIVCGKRNRSMLFW